MLSVRLSPSASLLLALQVTLSPKLGPAGLMLTLLTTGAVLAMVTVVDAVVVAP